MLRDLIDIASLEDFLSGMAGMLGRPMAAYDSRGMRIAVMHPPGRTCETLSERIDPPRLLIRVNDGPQPIGVAFQDEGGQRHVLAEVRSRRGVAGYLLASGFGGEDSLASLPRDARDPRLAPIRWAARQLTTLCAEEERLSTVSRELALLGDVGDLVSGDAELQTVLDRIVYETSRVMKCQYASLRLYDPKAQELRIVAAYNMSQQYTDIQSIPRVENPIDDEALQGRIVYTEDAQKDLRIPYREEVAELGIRSGLTAGLIYRGEPLGVLRVYSDHVRRFDGPHRHLLRAVAAQSATAIANARLLDQRIQSVRAERQLALAGAVQARMMRIDPPAHEHIETARVFDPSSHIGGDFCDIFDLPDGRLVAVVGDVVGHGPAAALLMASIRGAIRASSRYTSNLEELVNRLNRHVARTTLMSEFVTLLFVAVDEDARSIEYCNCGHEALMLAREGEVMLATEGGLVLGIDPHEVYRTHRLALKPRDFLLLYTDGAMEAMNFNGELFGRRRLLKLVKRFSTQSPENALQAIHWDIRRFVGLAERSDDITLVAIRVRGEGAQD